MFTMPFYRRYPIRGRTRQPRFNARIPGSNRGNERSERQFPLEAERRTTGELIHEEEQKDMETTQFLMDFDKKHNTRLYYLWMQYRAQNPKMFPNVDRSLHQPYPEL
jgi:hypothetical protein